MMVVVAGWGERGVGGWVSGIRNCIDTVNENCPSVASTVAGREAVYCSVNVSDQS